jgi:hypothetical protein
MPRLSTGSLLAALFIGVLVTGSPAEAATVVAQRDDATIAHDASAGSWTLSTAGASLTLALDPSRDFAIVSLLSASGATWNTSAAADTLVHVGSRTLAFGSRPAGFAYRDVAVVTSGNTLRLDATNFWPAAMWVIVYLPALPSLMLAWIETDQPADA